MDRSVKTPLLTVIAMIAFAANSLLCRAALGDGQADAASFTTLRIASGALMLVLIAWPSWRRQGMPARDWRAVLALFTYMVFFSFAYLTLGAGTGALLLFGAVQLTMFVAAIRAGEPFPALSWLGLALAIGGLVWLVAPGITAPDPWGAAMMALAGIGWGVYSLRGRLAADPLGATAVNFLFSIPLALLVSVLFMEHSQVTPQGAILAVSSGALASGLGYVIWYAALKGLTASRAATVQLSVPVIAALGGVVLLAEPFSSRLLVSSLVTLGGIALVLSQRTTEK